MNTLCYIWLSISIGFLLLEVGHPGLFLFLSFFFGGIVGFLVCFFQLSLTGQIVSFLLTSFVLFLMLSKFSYRFEVKKTKTNVYALQGKKAFVISRIEPFKTGQIKCDGQIWTARSIDNKRIEKDALIQIESIQGAHALVKQITHYKELS